jgi:tRNA(His) guanylyltransferase
MRSTIQSLGQYHFSPKEMHGLNNNEVQEKLFQTLGINFNDTPTAQKRGVCIIKEKYYVELPNPTIDGAQAAVLRPAERTRWITDTEIPLFTQDRDYVGKYV